MCSYNMASMGRSLIPVRGRIRWFKKVLVVILCYLSNIKLQTARVSTLRELQTWDHAQKFSFEILLETCVSM